MVRGVHDRRQAVSEHRHDHALPAVDHHDKEAGVGHVFLHEANEAVADLVLLGLELLAVEGVLVALRHLWAKGCGCGRDRVCFMTTSRAGGVRMRTL